MKEWGFIPTYIPTLEIQLFSCTGILAFKSGTLADGGTMIKIGVMRSSIPTHAYLDMQLT